MLHTRKSNTWLIYILQVLFTAGMYFLLARASLLFQFQSTNATPVWPPSGFAFAIVLLWGFRMAPGIFIGAFTANFLIYINNQIDSGTAAWLSTVIGLGNTGEALAGIYLIKMIIPGFTVESFFERASYILRFALVAALMSLVSSLIGTSAISLAGINPDVQLWRVWLTWWLGDFSGILLITSFILIWLKSVTQNDISHYVKKKSTIEIISFFLVVILSGGIIFNDWAFSYSFLKWAYWIIPILVWAALRFGQREMITTIFIYSAIAIWGALNNRGPFGSFPLNESLLALQGFIAIMLITKLTLNTTVLERNRTEAMLRITSNELEARVKSRTSQLEERNQFVETILNSSFDSIVVLDKDTRCISINKVAKNQLRMPYPENVIGKKISEVPPFVLPPGSIEDVRRALNGEAVHREKVASTVSDTYFEMDYIPIHTGEEVTAVMVVGHDITQRIHAEHEIREQKAFAELLIENSPYMILAYDKNGVVTAWNKKSEKHSGITKEQIIGRHIFELFPEYNNEWWNQTTAAVFNEGKSFHFPQIAFTRIQGWGESFINPLYNSRNEIIGLLAITHDVTELINMTSAMEQKNRDLQKTNEELSSFAYVASHDLQEPLRKIQIFSKRITDSEFNTLSDTAKDYFDRMRSAAQRMQQLIEDLLSYSRMGTSGRKLEKIHLQEIIDEVKEILKDEIVPKKAIIEADRLCECVVIPFQIQQLVQNLISNSLKFAKPDVTPHIIISSRIAKGIELEHPALHANKDYCHICFQDNGIGFDPEFNEQIFGLFQRLHGKTEYPGTGIGLAICKKIIENHNGIITASGKPGVGATFNIYLPDLNHK